MKTSATLLTLRIPDFEAAIRKAVDSRLASRPVVVVTSFKQLGMVVAACPEARRSGVAEAMHFSAARLRCPDAAFHLPDRRLAEQVMRLLLARAGKYSPLVEPAGGGSVLLDTRGTERLWGDTRAVAGRLQRDVREGLRLPAAAGLATRRPWSMLASRAAGDDGICQVPPGSEDSFLDEVPTAWLEGLTPRTRTLLLEMNIRSLGQLRSFGQAELRRQFGKNCGDILWNAIHPPEWDMVAPFAENALLDRDADRIRAEAALAEASVVADTLRLAVRTLAARLAASLRSQGLGAARLRLTLFHADGGLKTVETRTGGYVQEEAALQAAAERLLARAFVRRVRAIRLWLEAEKLSPPERQGVLFPPGDPEGGPAAEAGRREKERLLTTVDSIRALYGSGAMRPAALLPAKKRNGVGAKPGQGRLAFAGRPPAPGNGA